MRQLCTQYLRAAAAAAWTTSASLHANTGGHNRAWQIAGASVHHLLSSGRVTPLAPVERSPVFSRFMTRNQRAFATAGVASDAPLALCVVGSGPAGFYSAEKVRA